MEINGVNNIVDKRSAEMNINVVNPIKAGSKEDKLDKLDKLDIGDRKKYTEDEIIGAIENANKEFIAYDRRFEFSIHEKTKQIMVKIIDVSNDEVIREIPPEKILDLVAAICEISGILVDERA
jgi:flagellar protein FlaG